MDYTYNDVAKMIDHSLLNPTLTRDDLEVGCRVALAYDTASVCTMPFYLNRCAELLRGSKVNASTTIGFPHGVNTTFIKATEARQAIADGGEELDMVVNISKVLSGDWAYVRDDIKTVVDIAHAAGAKVKVIFENCYLQDAHKIRLCEICGELRADWVKTSTGYGSGRDPRGPYPDAETFSSARAGEGGGRRARFGCAAGGAGARRFALRGHAYGEHVG